jgi:HTH-type transcriptional regulator/antitoxin HigA
MNLADTFHPGVFLEEELEARGWTRADLGNILGRAANDISLIITGKRGITPETAIGLGDAFGTGPEYWMNLETAYQLSVAQNKRANVALKARLYQRFPVREMLKRGWVEATDDVEILAQRFCEFFEIQDVDSPVRFNHAAFKSTAYDDTTPVQETWLFRARQLARKSMLSNTFSVAKLKSCKAKLRALMHEAEEIRRVPAILSEAGIRFVVVEFLPSGKMDGATFWLNDNSPVIAMSLLRDRIDNFWFVLIHELSHIENGEGKDDPIIDIDICSQDSSPDLSEMEMRANRDAAAFLVDQCALENFILRTDPYYHQTKIEGFAYLHKIHPGIVVGQLQKRGRVRWDHHRKLLEKVRAIVSEAAITDGYGFEVR